MQTRRSALRNLGLLGLLAAGRWPGWARAADAAAPRGSFRFIAVNDLHHAAPECDPWFRRAVARMKERPGHEFALVLGDLTDTAKPSSFDAVKSVLGDLGVRFHPVIGNHDQTATDAGAAYDAAFPGTRNHAFEHGGWQFVGIDSTQGTAASDTRVSGGTLGWLDQNLPRLDKRRPVVLFTHFPLGKGASMVPSNADDVLARFVEFNLRGVFSGHYHAYTEALFHGTPVVTGRCCSRIRNNHDGSKEKGWWSLEAANGRLTRTFVEFEKSA